MKPIKLLVISLFCIPLLGIGQSLAPTVFATTGGYDTAGNFNLSFSVGEAVVATLLDPPDFYLTQGFQQPESIAALNVSLNKTDETCINSNDGTADLIIRGGVGPYKIAWSSKPGFTGTTLDSIAPGAYTVNVKDGNGLSTTIPYTIIANDAACNVKIYTGITPNGDGHNDTWVIDFIDLFPNNTVSICNRWGTEVWNATGYDNTKVVWKGEDTQGQPLPDGTYFYIVNIGGPPLKGWVQLTR
jgi:gliding motility-associated-like protein